MCGAFRKWAGRFNCGKLSKHLFKQCLLYQENKDISRYLYCRTTSFKSLKNERLTLRELSHYPILMLDKNSTTNEFLHRLFQQHQLDLVPEIELTSNDLLIDLARIGLGIAFLPDYCIAGNMSGLFIVETKEELPGRELVIAYNEQIPLSKAAQEFLSYFSS